MWSLFYTKTLPKLIKILYSIEESVKMFLFFSNISIVVYSFVHQLTCLHHCHKWMKNSKKVEVKTFCHFENDFLLPFFFFLAQFSIGNNLIIFGLNINSN